MTRYAIVTTSAPSAVATYLPENYAVVGITPDGRVVLRGDDQHGWTLDDYVIPRLASGLHWAKEITADDPAIAEVADQIPANVTVWHDGTISLFSLDDASKAWVEEHVLGEKQWFGGRLAVEARYVDDLIDGMLADGLVVEKEEGAS